MRALTWVVVGLLGLVAPIARSQTQPPDPPGSITWAVLPASPTTQDFIFVQSVLTGCDSGGRSADDVVFDPASGFVDIHLTFGSDVCENYVTNDVENISIGYLPAGSYMVRFISCGMPFDPLAECNETAIPRLPLVVTENGGSRQVIPASSWASKLALGAALAAIALWLLRLRR